MELLRNAPKLAVIRPNITCLSSQIRYASTGGRGTTKNTRKTNRNRRRGFKVADGDYVHPGTILAKQIHNFLIYPGSYVMVGRNMTLTALTSGTVRITRELFVPKKGTDLANAVEDMPIGSFLYKPTINIVPDKEVGLFKLKEQI